MTYERPRIEVRTFAVCPNAVPAVELVERVAAELGVEIEGLVRVDIQDAAEAVRRSFLGSPTIRVDGRDIEPWAERRTDFVCSCRVYRTESGFCGLTARQLGPSGNRGGGFGLQPACSPSLAEG